MSANPRALKLPRAPFHGPLCSVEGFSKTQLHSQYPAQIPANLPWSHWLSFRVTARLLGCLPFPLLHSMIAKCSIGKRAKLRNKQMPTLFYTSCCHAGKMGKVRKLISFSLTLSVQFCSDSGSK